MVFYSTVYVQCYVRICKYGFCYLYSNTLLLNANIVMLCHTFFVVNVVKSAIVATCMQTGSSQHAILRFDNFGFHTRSSFLNPLGNQN